MKINRHLLLLKFNKKMRLSVYLKKCGKSGDEKVMLDSGFRIPDTGYWILDVAGFWMLVTGQ